MISLISLYSNYFSATLNISQPLASCYLHTEQIVTGLSLPPIHLSNRGNDHPFIFFHGGKQFIQHPDCGIR